MVKLTATPHSALVDEKVTIFIGDLDPSQSVTLVAVLRDEQIKLWSHAHYIANQHGDVDVAAVPSTGGSYTGVEPMGFIWSMKLASDQRQGTRLMKRNVQTPMHIDLLVYPGHLNASDSEKHTKECLASSKIERWYLSEDVDRIDIRRNDIKATLFVPKGPGLYPGVLDLFGNIGGLVEYRAALLASRGFVTLSLAYFSHKEGMKSNLEYYEEAVNLLAQHPKVLPYGIGILGVSTGAEVAHIVSCISPKVKAVVAINGLHFVFGKQMTYRDEVFQPGILEMELSRTPEGQLFKWKLDYNTFYQSTVRHIMPVERSLAKRLCIHGSDDTCAVPASAEFLQHRLLSYGRPASDCKIVVYKDAGHLIEPPYSPHFRASFHKTAGGIFVWGGIPKAHAQAQEDSWQLIQNFLRQNLALHTSHL